jgi:hypothetical protein
MPRIPFSPANYAPRLMATCALLLAVTSCSQGDDAESDSPETNGESAAQVCDGTLTGPAIGDLEQLAGQDEFIDYWYPGGSVDLAGYLDGLRESEVRWEPYCKIYAPIEERNPFATLEFGWRESATSIDEADPNETLYDAGEFSHTEDQTAFIEFTCPVGASRGGYLVGGFYTYDVQAGNLHMSILNSVSRAVAEGLGCLEEAGLPEGAPERLDG